MLQNGPNILVMNQSQSWASILGKLLAKEDLDRGAANWAMREIMAGEASEAQVGAFMMALRSKGESVAELAGLVDEMLERSVILDTGDDAVDIVGTGGDMVGTVNISTMASILVAAAGVPVMKHGSRSASGKTGSSEMLEVLGIRLDLAPERVAEIFKECGITFFFAPVFHPAMRHVAPIRKQLGVPTTFNFLGPLANPAQPIATSLGVANPLVAPLMAAEVAARGRTALVFRGDDGLDELTTTGPNTIWQVSQGQVLELRLNASDLGLKRAKIENFVGGDAHHNAEIAKALVNKDTTVKNLQEIREITLLNAAAGVVVYRLAKYPELATESIEKRFRDAIALVQNSLDSGAASEKLSKWIEATQA
jgi:anthranilate phosphoribosyltransferase